MLNFDPIWRYTSPGAIASEIQDEFFLLIKKVGAQHGNRQHILEHYKTYFADAAGRTSYTSSGLGWAESDLRDYMGDAAQNAPLFVEAFYDVGIAVTTRNPQLVVPQLELMNHILAKHASGYEIAFPNLLSRNVQAPVPFAEAAPSLDAQALEIVQRSMKQSEQYLSLGQERQAVQEILWLLETVSMAFQGLQIGESTVQGKYFNKIASDLRRHHKDKTLD
jgi:hypothetical protein